MRIKYLCRRWRLRHATTVSHYPLQSLTDTHVSRKTPSISRRSQRWYVLHAVQSSSRSKEYAYVQSPALLVVGEPQFRTAGDSTTKKHVVFHGMNTTQVQAFCLKGKMISCKYWFCSYLGIPYKNVQTWNVRTWKWQVFFFFQFVEIGPISKQAFYSYIIVRAETAWRRNRKYLIMFWQNIESLCENL
jgi:hypothetical protein